VGAGGFFFFFFPGGRGASAASPFRLDLPELLAALGSEAALGAGWQNKRSKLVATVVAAAGAACCCRQGNGLLPALKLETDAWRGQGTADRG